MNKEILATKLTYAGGIPFLGIALALIFNMAGSESLIQLLLTYSAIIVSFMAGIHWGAYLFERSTFNLFIHSNVLALIAWLALFIPINFAFIVLAFCFIYLLKIDSRLYEDDKIQLWYWQLRTRITCVVVVSLFFAWLSID